MEVPNYAADGFNIGLTLIFIILNGFFVAAEFALVKLNKSKIKAMMRENQPFASTAMWIFNRQNMALSACQLGITMASLALGWIGEPAIAHLIKPLIISAGIVSENLLHGISFAIAFSIITALHIVIGEQVPKIYAIRRPAPVMLGTALLLKGFYMILFPFMYVLNAITNVILRWLGIRESGDHDAPLTEEEIRASLSMAYSTGELSKTEHKLLNAVFRFDDEVASKIMRPRGEVQIMNANDSFLENLEFAKNSRHSRFPLCEDSLDKIVGVVHIKDLLGVDDNTDLKALARTPMIIPESILIGKLMQEFRMAKQHFAFVQDEHGTVIGIITLEDVIEEIMGNIQDEFDLEEDAEIDEKERGVYIVAGDAVIDELNEKLNINLESLNSDTLSGHIVEKVGHKLKKGTLIELDSNVKARLLEIDGIRVKKVELIVREPDDE